MSVNLNTSNQFKVYPESKQSSSRLRRVYHSQATESCNCIALKKLQEGTLKPIERETFLKDCIREETRFLQSMSEAP